MCIDHDVIQCTVVVVHNVSIAGNLHLKPPSGQAKCCCVQCVCIIMCVCVCKCVYDVFVCVVYMLHSWVPVSVGREERERERERGGVQVTVLGKTGYVL